MQLSVTSSYIQKWISPGLSGLKTNRTVSLAERSFAIVSLLYFATINLSFKLLERSR